MEQKSYVIRREGIANRFGLGEVILLDEKKIPINADGTLFETVRVPSVCLFKDGHYHLTAKELEHAISRLPKGTVLLNA